jgi:murein DD-endopeptidase MepM/ murein hydrolase activator NlpD
MAPVDQHRETDRSRAPVVDERVHRRANRPAREEDVVDQHHYAVVDGERYLGLADDGCVADPRQVVAIEGDVDRAEWDLDALIRADGIADPCSQSVAARADADDREKSEIAIALDDLVRDPRDGPADIVRREQRGRSALLPGLSGPVLKGGGARRSIGTVAGVRIVLAIAAVILFGAVAVAASTSRAEIASRARPTPAPFHTAMPAVATDAPDMAAARVRTYAWLAGRFIHPLEGSTIPEEPELLPGAPRDYRAGIHEGIDFPADEGAPARAAADGTVSRVDSSFRDWTQEELDEALAHAVALGYTPSAMLDRIRGRQVWIDHGRGVVTRYAHLSLVADLIVGQRVSAGTVIGSVGSSGYPQGGPHLHFEVRIGDEFYGDGQSGSALVLSVSRLFR